MKWFWDEFNEFKTFYEEKIKQKASKSTESYLFLQFLRFKLGLDPINDHDKGMRK